MNTVELTSVVKRINIKGTYFLGVFACDNLPKSPITLLPCMGVVNTDPSSLPGQHWLGFYITKNRHGLFFDSFGNSPDKYPRAIKNFLLKNCYEIMYSRKQVQSFFTTTCGHHCVFFLYNMQKSVPYKHMIKMYSSNLERNDAMVCSFVNKIQPISKCLCYTFDCVQR